MESAVKAVKLMRLVMLVSVVIYVALGESLAHPSATLPNMTIFYAFTFLAASMVVVLMLVRRLLIAPAAAVLATQASSALAANRWRAGQIASLAIAEGIALYGLVLRFLGFGLAQVAPFYVATVILLVMLSPRRPSNELT